MEKLPVDIAFEIFYRLPPESVVRCKFVCKSWCNLLPISSTDDSNNFANMHLLRQRNNNLEYSSTLNFIGLDKLIRSDKDDHHHHEVRGRGRRSCGGEFHITEYDEEKLNYKVKTIKLPDHIGISECSWGNMDPKLAGSCNGLLCLPRIYDQSSNFLVKDRICICNPLLNEYVSLPLSDLQFRYGSMDTTYNMAVGFGHHRSTDEYKVVRVYYPHSNSYTGDVEVYTLGNKSSMWRSKGTINYRLLTWSRPVLIDGSLHWLAEKRISYHDHDLLISLARHQSLHIVSFNLEDEEFHVIPDVPQVPNDYCNWRTELRELGGCLCLIHKGEKKLMDIWVWKDYMNNKEYSWVKEFSIKWRKGKRESFYYSPCAIINQKKKKKKNMSNGDHHLFLMWCNLKKLVYYDSKTQNFEYVVRGSRQVLDQSSLPPQPSYQNPILHINSVVSLKALGEDGKLSSSENHLKRKAVHEDIENKDKLKHIKT